MTQKAFLLPSLLLAASCAMAQGPCDSVSAEFEAVVTGLGVNFQNAANPAGTQYIWDFGDGNNGSGPNPFYTYADSGEYYVCLIAWWWIPGTDDTCFVDHCEWISVLATGITEFSDPGLFAWPMPFSDAVHIFVQGLGGELTAQLIAADGGSIEVQRLHPSDILHFSWPDLAPGHYLLVIRDGRHAKILRLVKE